MDIDTFKYNLNNLTKLQTDLEKQMLQFDEIIPFERQTTAKIFSPRLLNMMIVCGPQVEAVTELICKRCNIDVPEKKNVPELIKKINSKAVLSNFEIVSLLHNLLFTPFTRDLEWWQTYNRLKHELAEQQSKITYTVVMDGLAALAGLHFLAHSLTSVRDEAIPKILDRENWLSSEELKKISPSVSGQNEKFWHTLLFKVNNSYNPY